MVLVKTIETRDPSNLRISRIRRIRNRERNSSLDTMISLNVANLTGGTSVNV